MCRKGLCETRRATNLFFLCYTLPVSKARWQVYITYFIICAHHFFSLSLFHSFTLSLFEKRCRSHKDSLLERVWQSLAAACRDTISSMEGGLFPNTSPSLNKRSWWWQIRLGLLLLVGGQKKEAETSKVWHGGPPPFIPNDIFTRSLHDHTTVRSKSGRRTVKSAFYSRDHCAIS